MFIVLCLLGCVWNCKAAQLTAMTNVHWVMKGIRLWVPSKVWRLHSLPSFSSATQDSMNASSFATAAGLGGTTLHRLRYYHQCCDYYSSFDCHCVIWKQTRKWTSNFFLRVTNIGYIFSRIDARVNHRLNFAKKNKCSCGPALNYRLNITKKKNSRVTSPLVSVIHFLAVADVGLMKLTECKIVLWEYKKLSSLRTKVSILSWNEFKRAGKKLNAPVTSYKNCN